MGSRRQYYMNQTTDKDRSADVIMQASEKSRILSDQLSKCALNLHHEGKLREAIVCYEHILQLRPDATKIHNNLAVALKALGRPQDAVRHYEKALSMAPNYPEAHNNLGNAYRALGRSQDAIESYRKALSLKKNYAEAHYNFGNVLKDIGRSEAAIEQYNIALAIKPNYTEAHNDLGIAHQGLNRIELAIEHYRKSLALKPDYAEAHNNLGAAQQMLGQKDEAVSGYLQAIRLKPAYAAAHRQLAMIAPDKANPTTMQQLLERPGLDDGDAIHLHFGLGEVFNQHKDYRQAFQHFQQGNAIKYNTQPFDADAHAAMIDRLINTYTADLTAAKARHGLDTRLPVFILGMPRSGTTLVEQILSSHPAVYGAGELAYMTAAEKSLVGRLKTDSPYPDCVGEVDQTSVQHLAQEYVQKVRALSADARHITDKMPDNFLRIGLIKILFPNASIIHCRRKPMDICTSIYLRLFTSKIHSYAYNFSSLSAFYLQYERLMEHWQRIFADKIFELQYEDLVAEPAAQIRRMLDFIGLD